MTLSPEHRRFLIVDQGVGATVINFLLNGGIAWALFHSVAYVPLWGQSSIAGDTFATAFLLPLLTCLIVTRIVHRQVASGHLLPLAVAPKLSAMQLLISLSTLRRGMLLGIGGVVLAALPTVLWFVWAGPSEVSLGSFLWFKASFAAVLAAGVTPLIAWLALASPSSHGLNGLSR
jgi:hypothetical protein